MAAIRAGSAPPARGQARRPILLIFLAAAGCAAAQDLPPDLALLTRIKTHMRDEVLRVTNYTCLETTARFHAEAWGPAKALSKLRPLDTVRLEIIYANHREWYGGPGDVSLSHDDPVAFIAGGMIGNGFFAITLNNVFVSGAATFTYRGERKLGARTAYGYDFRLPRTSGGLTVSLFGGIGTVGEEGTFWVDAQSLDLIRLESKAVEIPPYLPLEDLTLNTTYARTQIGERSVLLAQTGDLYMVKTSGEEHYNHLEYTHCHEFSAQSAIRFDDDATPAADASPNAGAVPLPAANGRIKAVPPFLPVTLRLVTPMTDRGAVGSAIEARVSGNVVQKGKVAVPDGSVVRGRIRRLEQYNDGAEFIVGLEFTEIVVNGEAQRFYADLLRMDKRPDIRPSLSEPAAMRSDGTVRAEQTVTIPELPGVASFFVKGKTFTIPSGFQMYWRTRGLIR